MDFKIIYEDSDVLVADKPAGIVVFREASSEALAKEDSLIDLLLEKNPELKNVGQTPRYGIVHRLDKDTSGILLVAKTNEALIFLQKQFRSREVEKKYIALATGDIKDDMGVIETLIGRSPQDPRKQKAYPLDKSNKVGQRQAFTEYKIIAHLRNTTARQGKIENYTLLEIKIKTGRKHQIRCHLAYIHHPIAGDKIYGFKDSPKPDGLDRQFLHAAYLKTKLSNGQIKEFYSDLPEELKIIINNLEKIHLVK